MSQNKLHLATIMLLLLCLLLPVGALAYSYGDPNKEDVAESFKEIVVELSESPIDWITAAAIYKTRRAEISSHFGEDIAITLDVNLSDENKDAFIANYKAVLGLNLKRRFDYSIKDFDDYAAAKLLVAKAKGTYDVMRPYLPSKQTAELDTAFEVAYTSLGNPGLFGVGEKPSDEAEFKKQSSFILDTILPLFPYTSAKAAVEEPAEAKPALKPEVKPAPEPEKKPAPIEEDKPALEDDNVSAKDEPVVVVPAEPKESIDEDIIQDTNNTELSEATDSDPEVEAQSEATDDVAIEHAPMERTKKTNPLISIIVIAALIAIIGTTLWILRKKKLI